MKKRLVFLAATLALAVASALSVAVASAGSPYHPPMVPVGHGTSLNWAGYAVETNFTTPTVGAVTDVKGSWAVPAVTCTSSTGGPNSSPHSKNGGGPGSNSYSSTWVGIDGYSDNTVEQTGTDQDCSAGSPYYYAWYEMYPAGTVALSTSKYPVHAGDSMTAEVSYSNGNFTLTLSDTTAGWTNNAVVASSGQQRSSAEWIEEAPGFGMSLPLADFGTVKFSGAQATLNGKTGPIDSSNWQDDAITMESFNGTIKAVPSGLTDRHSASSFSVTWKHR